jgi:hypothetical protein
LARALVLPAHYGSNWDAFWDCIRDEWPLPGRLVVGGLDHLEKTLPEDADLFLRCLADYNNAGDPTCAAETSDDYAGVIHFVQLEVRPVELVPDGPQGAIVNCWLKRAHREDAESAAKSAVEEDGWSVVSVDDVRRGSTADYDGDDADLGYFKQSCFDDQSLVFYTWDNEDDEGGDDKP